jgi:hypothetical protein
MRTFWGLVLGILLFFPGTVLVQATIKKLWGTTPTLTDACMSIIMVLLTVFVVQHKPARASAEGRVHRVSRQPAGLKSPRYTEEPRPAPRRPSRRPRDWED